MYAQYDLGLLGFRAQIVETLASVLSLVVFRACDEGERVPAFSPGGRVGGVHLNPVPEPGRLGQGIPSRRSADQSDGLSLPDRLTVQIAGDFWWAGRIYNLGRKHKILLSERFFIVGKT